MRSLLLYSLLSLTACGGDAPKAPAKDATKTPAKDAKPACTLDFASLADSVWVRLNPDGDKKDLQSRLRFYKEGDALKANYTAGSVGDVYTYTCTPKGDTMSCLEDEIHADAWCHAYAAVHDGVCDPAAVATMVGVSVDVMKPVADKVNKELKALKGAEKDTQKKADNNPNNKIRSHFIVAVNKAKCGLTVQDKFLSMFNGQVQEYENTNGTSAFVKDETEYFWKSCSDSSGQVVDDAGKPRQGPYDPGTLKVQAGLGDKEKADAGCTYTADVWADWQKATSDVPSSGSGAKLTFSTALPFTNPGIHAVYFERHKTCGDKKTDDGVTCAAFRVVGAGAP